MRGGCCLEELAALWKEVVGPVYKYMQQSVVHALTVIFIKIGWDKEERPSF